MLKQLFRRWTALCLCGVLLAAVSPLQAAEAVPEISGQSAILLAADTGTVLYEKDSREQLPMASTTKIMTALLTLEEAERLGDPVVEITPEMVAVEGSSMGLLAGDRISLSGLAAGMLLASGNDAANAAALYLAGSQEEFARRMNLRALELGMEDTHFVTPSGLDGESADGLKHCSTAYDMALLAREALENQGFRELCSSSTRRVSFAEPEKEVVYTNHNKLLTQYEGCVGVKTGYTKEAGRCLVSAAERDGALLIAVTLNAPDDWNDHARLLDYGFSQMKTVTLAGGDVQGKAPVVGSEKETLCFYGQDGGTVSLPAEAAGEITRKLYGPAFLYAPVSSGQPVGEIRWYWGGTLLGSAPLVAGENALSPGEENTWLPVPWN